MPKIEMGKKYRYRNGKPARIICVDIPGNNYPVVSVSEKDCCIYQHADDGKFVRYSGEESGRDLIEVVEPVFVPLEAMDILPSYRFTYKNGPMNWWESASSTGPASAVLGSSGIQTYEQLRNSFYVDRLDGKGWVACEKELHQEA